MEDNGFCKKYVSEVDGEHYSVVSYQRFDSFEDAREWEEETWRYGQICEDYSPTGKWFISDAHAVHVIDDLFLCVIQYALDV